MAGRGRKIIEHMYGRASKAEELPWHNPEPPELLVAAMERRATPGRALDVGCGAGTYSIYMAQHGYQVTALDYMQQAVDMLQSKSAGMNLKIDAVQADIGVWNATDPYDIVLDIGCLHTPGTIAYERYRQQLLNWLAPGGDLVLLHFARRGWWDVWPIGPTRKYKDEVIELFSPDLELVEYRPHAMTDMPFMIGGSAEVGRYWFHRPATE